MRGNERKLKVSPLLVTRDEANVATNEATPVRCLRVSGVPNEATLASFPASPLGVNGAKRAKWSHKIEISRESVVPAQRRTRATASTLNSCADTGGQRWGGASGILGRGYGYSRARYQLETQPDGPLGRASCYDAWILVHLSVLPAVLRGSGRVLDGARGVLGGYGRVGVRFRHGRVQPDLGNPGG